jgi:hypothetical protein
VEGEGRGVHERLFVKRTSPSSLALTHFQPEDTLGAPWTISGFENGQPFGG